MSERVTAVSDAHLSVIHWLQRHGVELIEEVTFPPFTVDCYVPRFHVVIEVDGPQHRASRDKKRDLYLGEAYNLLVGHIPAGAVEKVVHDEVVRLFRSAADTARVRRQECLMRVPGL